MASRGISISPKVQASEYVYAYLCLALPFRLFLCKPSLLLQANQSVWSCIDHCK